jgi:hypothetical protein
MKFNAKKISVSVFISGLISVLALNQTVALAETTRVTLQAGFFSQAFENPETALALSDSFDQAIQEHQTQISEEDQIEATEVSVPAAVQKHPARFKKWNDRITLKRAEFSKDITSQVAAMPESELKIRLQSEKNDAHSRGDQVTADKIESALADMSENGQSKFRDLISTVMNQTLDAELPKLIQGVADHGRIGYLLHLRKNIKAAQDDVRVAMKQNSASGKRLPASIDSGNLRHALNILGALILAASIAACFIIGAGSGIAVLFIALFGATLIPAALFYKATKV